jgi:hypothetical protein
MLKLRKKKATMWNGNNMGTSSATWVVASHPHIEIWSSGSWGWNATDTSGLARKSIVCGAMDRRMCLEQIETFIRDEETEMKKRTSAVIAQASIALSDVDNQILSKMRHDGTRWLFDEKPMDGALQTQLHQLIGKMDKLVDDAQYAMGFKLETKILAEEEIR